jgi:hypothetical protein
MQKEKALKEIKSQLELLQKQFEAFTWNGNIPNEAEVQMLKQKVMALYDKLNQLEFAEKTLSAVRHDIPVVEERIEVKQEITPVAEIPAPQEIIQTEEKISPVEVPTPSPEIVLDTKVIEEVQQTRKEVFAEPATSIASSYNGITSLHDKIASSNHETAIADKLKLTPIADLTKAIGINEKFLFIKELFGNNSEVFQRVVSELNSCSDFTMASFHAENETVKKFGADANSETYLKFVELVQRRFLK